MDGDILWKIDLDNETVFGFVGDCKAATVWFDTESWLWRAVDSSDDVIACGHRFSFFEAIRAAETAIMSRVESE